jgi:CRP/FNR family transcriptional regulator, dissimilatory nitrate respiration regulator
MQVVVLFSLMKPKAQVTDKQEAGYRKQSLGCLRGASLFSGLSDDDIACFQDAAQSRSYRKGKVLYLQDELAESFYVICGGWIKLFHTMPEGEEIIIDMLTTGHMVGESAIFEHGRHTSSAQVIEDVQLLSIPAHILKEQIRLSPTLALSMLSSMSRHHRRHYSAIALNAMQSAPQRIGCFLLRLCPQDKKKSASFHLPYDKTLIAETLGMKSATFSRALNILRQKAGIHINRTCVEIDSVAQLTKFVYGPLAAKYTPEEM